MTSAIVINLDRLRDLMKQFVTEVDPQGEHLLEWTFETFLQWLKKKQEQSYEQTQTTPGITGTGTN